MPVLESENGFRGPWGWPVSCSCNWKLNAQIVKTTVEIEVFKRNSNWALSLLELPAASCEEVGVFLNLRVFLFCALDPLFLHFLNAGCEAATV